MGWASGSTVAEPIIKAIKKEKALDDKAKLRLYTALLTSFQDADWDTEGECAGICPVFDGLLKKKGLHGDEEAE
jgi:hypothetical protein